MNEAQALQSIKNILAEKNLKSPQGDVKTADRAFMGCIDALKSIIDASDIVTLAIQDAVSYALEEFNKHLNLGVIANGKFSEIPPSIAGVHNLTEGQFTTNGLLILTKDKAIPIVNDPSGSDWPFNSVWDETSDSLVSRKAWYRRHPQDVFLLSEDEVSNLNLQDLYNDISASIEKD